MSISEGEHKLNQIKIEPGKLLDKKGRLSQSGYATELIKT